VVVMAVVMAVVVTVVVVLGGDIGFTLCFLSLCLPPFPRSYLIPSIIFAIKTLAEVAEIAEKVWGDAALVTLLRLSCYILLTLLRLSCSTNFQIRLQRHRNCEKIT
jgi:hypothetical protein